MRKRHLFQVGRLLVVWHLKNLGFQNAAEGDDGLAAMLLHPLKGLQPDRKPTMILCAMWAPAGCELMLPVPWLPASVLAFEPGELIKSRSDMPGMVSKGHSRTTGSILHPGLKWNDIQDVPLAATLTSS